MSKYTIRLEKLIEQGFKMFDFDYPLFNPHYKPILEQKILDHYYFYEIGFETPQRFKHYLRMKLNEIMPLFNQRYLSTLIEYDPLAATCLNINEINDFSEQRKAADSAATRGQQAVKDRVAEREDTTSTLHTDTEGNQTDENKTVNVGQETTNYTEDVTTHETEEGVTGSETNSETNTSTTDNGTKGTVGSSTKTGTSDETTSSNSTTYNYVDPQNLLSSDPLAGVYASTASRTNSSGTRSVESSERINSNEDVTTGNTGTSDTTGNTIVDADSSKTTDGTKNTVGNKVLDKESETDYNGTIDNTGSIDTDTSGLLERSSYNNTDTSTVSSSSSASTNERDYEAERNTAYSGRTNMSPAELIMIQRRAFINVDQEVVLALAPLFMGVL